MCVMIQLLLFVHNKSFRESSCRILSSFIISNFIYPNVDFLLLSMDRFLSECIEPGATQLNVIIRHSHVEDRSINFIAFFDIQIRPGVVKL